ncbi:histidinol-phosphate phosphatase family protein [Clostridium carnis]|uniref:Histidinol-phosphate phosphatase family protein n=1 Tax=Clostridium carnis TaxID=1530 RepID=A0ABY6SNY1_9CLOT|nr:HAD-IIIA family hydrolase [Clostridium carnis]VDG69859.1 histidinol-phosphate phosphatase family protein [Clostridium carnis]
MQAVIMAGGKGTRLASITKNEIPKPMAIIAGKPILEWQIECLKENGIKDITLIIGYLGNKIKEYFNDGSDFGVNINYIEEKEPLGTAGSFFYLKDCLKDEYFLLAFGDVIFDIDIERMERFHKENKSIATLFVHPNSHPFDSDLIVTDDCDRILEFDSKNNNRDYWYDNCVNAGFYILDKSLCDLVKEPQKLDLEKDILMKLAKESKEIYAYRSPEYIKDVGTVERISKAEEEILRGFVKKRNLKNKQKCIFIDRDGTLNKYNGLIYKEEEFILEDFVREAISLINNSGYLAIVITNQPVVARGLCEIKDVEIIHNKMKTLLGRDGVFFDDVVFCPHHPDKGYPEENPAYKIKCNCRKPNTGMIDMCVKKYNIDIENSWIIGDTTIDIQAGVNSGLKTALVLTGEAGKDEKYSVQANIVRKDLLEAVNTILKER